jgi:hypothetical protein
MGELTLTTEEHFVKIEGYDNYVVSNYGRVINTDTDKDVAIQTRPGGHKAVKLSKNGKGREFSLRRLVAQAFFTNYESWKPVWQVSVMNLTLIRPHHRPARMIEIVELNECYATAADAARRINGVSGPILKILMGMGQTYKGYTFKWVHVK